MAGLNSAAEIRQNEIRPAGFGDQTVDDNDLLIEDESDVINRQEKDDEPSYWNMPHKGQIFLLVICRITEPIAYSSISPYLYYMIRDFGYTDPAVITARSTVVLTSFALGQMLTAVLWGQFSDSYGRKPALMLGVLGTAIAVLVFGTATNIYWAVAGRMLAGLLNGNVGVMRTMIAEIIRGHKKYQTRVFAILPITFNVGMIIGPTIGGLLADPVKNYPALFGWSSLLRKYPYLLPNLFPIPLLVIALISTALFIDETGHGPKLLLQKSRDPFLKLGNKLKDQFSRHDYSAIEDLDDDYEGESDIVTDDESRPISLVEDPESPRTPRYGDVSSISSGGERPAPKARPTIRDVLTTPVKITLTSYVILMLHNPTFMQLLPLFLSTPRMKDAERSGLRFNGGLGLDTSTIGMIMSILGFVGVVLQLGVYPWLAGKLGTARLHQIALIPYVPMYVIIPFLSLLPAYPESVPVTGATIMAAMVVLARTFAVPPMTVLITNASPSPEVLGTLHGITHSVTSAARCIGPFTLGYLYSFGVEIGIVGLAWWVMAGITVVEVFVALRLREWGEEE